MSVRALFGRFLEIQKEQNEIMKELASAENSQQFWIASITHSAHMRDCHSRHWDPGIAVEEQKKVTSEIADLDQKFRENQERLRLLHKQLFAF